MKSVLPPPLVTTVFCAQSEVLRNTPAGEKEKVSKAMHRVMEHNQLFYCTNTEIVVGEMGKTNMDPIHAEVNAVQQVSSLATCIALAMAPCVAYSFKLHFNRTEECLITNNKRCLLAD